MSPFSPFSPHTYPSSFQFKMQCRLLDITRWPNRKLKSLGHLIASTKATLIRADNTHAIQAKLEGWVTVLKDLQVRSRGRAIRASFPSSRRKSMFQMLTFSVPQVSMEENPQDAPSYLEPYRRWMAKLHWEARGSLSRRLRASG